MFLTEQTPLAKVEDASFCIMWMGFWHRDLEQRKQAAGPQEKGMIDMVKNFMTKNTADDINFSCQIVILSVKLFRERFPHVKIDYSKMSSRFSEYLFQVSM